jgi:hypothetical protein
MGASEFIVAGHSHIFCMGAQQSYAGPVALLPVSVAAHSGFFLMEEWDKGRSERYWDRLVVEGRDRHVFLVFNGNQHFADFLISPTPMFDFFESLVPGPLLDGATIVPRRLIKEFFAPSLGALRGVVERLKQTGCPSITIIGTPPPRPDLSGALRHVKESAFFRGVAEQKGIALAAIELTPARIMLKLWTVIQELLADTAREFGAAFLPVPTEARDADGFLMANLVGPDYDFTHANNEYGHLMLRTAAGTIQFGSQAGPRAAEPAPQVPAPSAHLEPEPLDPEAGIVTIHFANTGNSDLYAGAGWSMPESIGRWTCDTKAELTVRGLAAGRDYRCEMDLGPFVLPPALPAQTFIVSCQGIQLFSEAMSEGAKIGFAVPRGAIAPNGELELVLRLPDAAVPSQLGPSTDGRRLGFSIWRARFEPAMLREKLAGSEPVPVRPPVAAAKQAVAAVTMVFNEPEYLPIWLRHNAHQVGIENCYVIDHGSDDGSTANLPGCQVIRIPRSPYDPIVQSAFTSKFCSSLACWYDRVVFSDVDEIVMADPRIAPTLRDYVARALPDVLHVIGLNVIHRIDVEPDLDLSRPVTVQRPYVFANSPMCKALMISRDVQWAGGSHSADAPVVFDHLYAFHLRWFDLRVGLQRMARTRAMAWAHHQAGGQARLADREFEAQIGGFGRMPRLDQCDFAPDAEPLAGFLDRVLRSQAGREFGTYKLDLDIWSNELWRIPERFIGAF